jgi:hypothetical protein
MHRSRQPFALTSCSSNQIGTARGVPDVVMQAAFETAWVSITMVATAFAMFLILTYHAGRESY